MAPTDDTPPTGTPPARPRLPREVWVLGFVSLLTDTSSEFVHSLLPLFLAGTLGASALVIGAIEGAAEFIALATKVFSGYVSDAMGRRKPLIVIGYALAALSKPLIPLAASVHWIVGARFLDRFGKGIRGAPRDALIADVTPPSQRGSAYGLRQSLDTIGAVLGPLLAIVALASFAGDMRLALWIAVVPGVLAVVLLVVGIREPEGSAASRAPRLPITRAGLVALGAPYWRVVALGALIAFARSSEAFLVLRASSVGMTDGTVPLVMVAMAVVFTLGAWPAGRLADRGGTRMLLIAGMASLVVADVLLAMANGVAMLFVGVLLWGLHMALTQGVLTTMIAATAPVPSRATAFGVFNLVSGVALFVASIASGALWDGFGPRATFLLGAASALVGALAVMAVARPRDGVDQAST